MSAKNIWGKVVLYLKEHHQVALHVACGDITDVRLDAQNLIIRVEEGMLANLLGEGKREIETALRWQGLDIGFCVESYIKEKTPQQQDIEKLDKSLGDYLKIIE